MATQSSERSLCFREASTARKERQINDDEYYHHLLKHLAGETHEYDIEYRTEDDYRLAKWDPFCHAVQLVYKEIPPIKDVTPFEQIFQSYRTGTYEDIISQHDSLDEEHAKYLRRILAMRALLDRRADVLQFCLDRGGFDYWDRFRDEANSVQHGDPKTMAVIEKSEFRRLHPRSDDPAAAFDVGGAYPVNCNWLSEGS